MDVTDIEHGWDVYGADGEKVGDVSSVEDTYIVVSKGLIFTSERYIPVSAITGVEHDRVYLNVTKDQIEREGWDRVPESSATVGTERGRPTGATRRAEGERTLELREEELRARKEPVQAGEARIGKEVVAEEKTVDVPVTREEVTVERRPVDRQPSDRPIGEGETIEVPVREERVSVEKQPVVYEEVEVGKRPVQETERVSETVRREEPRVEGDVDVRGDEPRRRG